MNFNDIETMVKSKFKDIKKHAEEIAHEIEVRSGYLRKAEQYKRLEFNLSFCTRWYWKHSKGRTNCKI